VGCADRSCYDLEKHEEATRKGLFAQDKLDEPKTVESVVLDCNMGFIGKTFKVKGKAIREHLDKLTQDDIKKLEKEFSSGSIKIKVDGEEFVLTKEAISIKTVTTKVSIEEYTPAVIEPSFGIGRILYSLLEHSFWVRESDEQRAVFSFKPLIAPIKCLVAPLSNKTEFDPLVEEIGKPPPSGVAYFHQF